MNGHATSDESTPPSRFLIQTTDADRVAWRVVVRRIDTMRVRSLASAGSVLTGEDVLGWFLDVAKRWPAPQPGEALSDFVVHSMRFGSSAQTRFGIGKR
jgi:hypothetical protein